MVRGSQYHVIVYKQVANSVEPNVSSLDGRSGTQQRKKMRRVGAKRDATTEARTSPPFSLSSSLPPFRQLIR
uniref:Uncharacterized protein n=1 Tax=Pristionchus pacificus TaxID=54126 RepID=A0A2A6CZB2_PRIPA|eukprot:PDM83505.1 hypothetical protein PRIPAC_35435 [Pristionchus pacificus]